MNINKHKSTHFAGFTLIEVMITVSIVAILVAIAYPSYTQYVARGARSEAHAALLRVSNLQEQYYLDNRVYAEDMTNLGLSADPFVTENGHYQVDSSGTTNFTATATAKGVQASRDSACGTIRITDTGAKTTTECWQ